MKDQFIKIITTLMFSWGGDPPPEAHWTLTELTKFYESIIQDEVPLRCKIVDESSTEYVDNLITFIKNKQI